MERREDWREWGEAGRSLRWAREVAIRRTGASLEAIASLLGASLDTPWSLPAVSLSPAPRSERDKKFELAEIRCQQRGISVGRGGRQERGNGGRKVGLE